MMIFFNNLGNSWFAKGIFSALALSMIAFWGLGGLSNNNQYANDAIVVGNQKVSANELLIAFNQEHQNLSQMLGGQYISPQKAMQMGLGDQVVQQQVAKLLSEQIKNDLGLTASNAAVQKYVEHHPAFSDALGKFDKNLFYAYLQKNKMSEPQLADKLQNELSM
jgi:parvulin-like peptidyl-prolyl isomerase